MQTVENFFFFKTIKNHLKRPCMCSPFHLLWKVLLIHYFCTIGITSPPLGILLYCSVLYRKPHYWSNNYWSSFALQCQTALFKRKNISDDCESGRLRPLGKVTGWLYTVRCEFSHHAHPIIICYANFHSTHLNFIWCFRFHCFWHVYISIVYISFFCMCTVKICMAYAHDEHCDIYLT